jgi:hypothetical protein
MVKEDFAEEVLVKDVFCEVFFTRRSDRYESASLTFAGARGATRPTSLIFNL